MPRTDATRPIATAELLAVGAELLVGETRDTNSGDLARSLSERGVEVLRMTQLPDQLDTIRDAVGAALARVDLVITTGGLGPTPDDLTREGIAAALGQTPQVDAGIERWLRELWDRRGLPFSEVNLKQAWLIPSAIALENPHGTAPGWWVEHGPALIIALPGPPREMQPMWVEQALPRLEARDLGIDRAARTLRLTGIGESAVVDLVGKDLLAGQNPQMATYARADSVDLRVSAVSGGSGGAAQIVAAAIEELSPRIDPYVFAYDEDGWDVALEARLKGRDLAVAETGTHGYLGLLLGGAPFLRHAEQVRPGPASAIELAEDVRARVGSSIGLAARCREEDDDMSVDIGITLEGARLEASVSVFRGGDAGRRRAANAAIGELWRQLGLERRSE